jgi:hypothetical protein
MKNIFYERQKFNQWWLWGILLSVFTPICYSVVNGLIHGSLTMEVFEKSNPIMPFFIVLLIIILFVLVTLTTKIDSTGIKMNFYPLSRKKVLWSEIDSVKVVNYGFIGGWGIRIGSPFGTVYNIKGKMGLAIKLKNGNKFLIGTQKEEELKKVVEDYYSESRN